MLALFCPSDAPRPRPRRTRIMLLLVLNEVDQLDESNHTSSCCWTQLTLRLFDPSWLRLGYMRAFRLTLRAGIPNPSTKSRTCTVHNYGFRCRNTAAPIALFLPRETVARQMSRNLSGRKSPPNLLHLRRNVGRDAN
jgi:hypothetical protein